MLGKGLVQGLQGNRMLSDMSWMGSGHTRRQKWPVGRTPWIGVGIYTKFKLPTGKPEPRASTVTGVIKGAGIMALLSLCLYLICR